MVLVVPTLSYSSMNTSNDVNKSVSIKQDESRIYKIPAYSCNVTMIIDIS